MIEELENLIRKETAKWFGFEVADEAGDLAAAIIDAGYVKAAPRCKAVTWGGPGHQSKHQCVGPVGHSGLHESMLIPQYEWEDDV